MAFLPQILATTDGKEHNADLISYDLIKKRTVYLAGEVNAESALSTITQFKYLASKSNRDIFFVIDSPGGEVDPGLAIYDIMQAINCDVCTIGLGHACSMGAFLLAAGTPGKRFASPNSEVMIHQPLGAAQGQATDISLVADHIQVVKTKLATILAKNCGKTLSEITNYLERDYWMSAIQAKEFGIVDYVGLPEFI
jgi:ATP-dependent Clp protease protease subunit